MTHLETELLSIVEALGAYVRHQVDSGATGVPRMPRPSRSLTAEGAATAASLHQEPAEPGPDERRGRGSEARLREQPPAILEVAPGGDREPPAGGPGVVETTPAPKLEALPRPLVPTERESPEARRLTLATLESEVRTCQKCGLSATRTNTVFARGNPLADLCFIGEAPGADEDAEGIPFVGRAGQLLDKMIAAMGLVPERDVYVCNIIKCRPPDNRRPLPEETAACMPYLEAQLAAHRPRVIVAMGNTAVGTLFQTKIGITKLRGAFKLWKGILVMPTYHPSYLLRPSAQQAAAKREAWQDLQAVMKQLGLSGTARG